jgi:hypothetical protein
MPQDMRLATCEDLHGLQRAQHSVENGPCFGCMWWHNKSFRLRVYFDTQMPATLMRPLPSQFDPTNPGHRTTDEWAVAGHLGWFHNAFVYALGHGEARVLLRAGAVLLL